MSQSIEAIYADGVFRPVHELDLADQQRVKLTFEEVKMPEKDRSEAMRQLIDGLRHSTLRLNGRAPRREDLYDNRV